MRRVVHVSTTHTGARAKAWCLLIHAEAYLSNSAAPRRLQHMSPRLHECPHHLRVPFLRGVAAQVEIESKRWKQFMIFQFQALKP